MCTRPREPGHVIEMVEVAHRRKVQEPVDVWQRGQVNTGDRLVEDCQTHIMDIAPTH